MKRDKWRCIQIAATLLYRYCGKIRIERVSSPLWDLIITVLGDSKYQFAVKLVRSSFRRTTEYKTYLQNIVVDKSSCSKPIVLLCVNEKEETATIGMLLGFFWNKAYLNDSLVMNRFDESSWAVLNERLLATGRDIHPIMSDKYMVVKEISVSVNKDRDNYSEGKIVYLRNLSETYKMQVSPKDLSFNEKFERLLNGIPQQEYPDDFLDKIIQKAICRQYPDNNSHNSLMIFSSDIRDVFLNYNRYPSRIDVPLTFTVEGDFDELKKVVGTILPSSITLNLLTFPCEEANFTGVSLSYGLKANDISNEIKEIFDLLPSYHQIKEYL